MADGQTTNPQQPPAMQESLGFPTAADYFRMLLASQNPQGMTQMNPSLQGAPPSQVKPYQDRRTDYGMDHSFGSVGERQRAERQNFVNTVSNVAGHLSQKLQERKQRETEQVFSRFNQAVQGINQAQSQIQQAKTAIAQAQAKLNQNPDDEDAKATIRQAAQQLDAAQQAMQVNQTILKDEYNPADPKGAKRLKMLQKGLGIDDKNADTPERQAAIAAMKKSMGNIGEGAAGILARTPQTQGLSPEAQAHQELNKAGVYGKPATGGQILGAIGKAGDQNLRQEKILSDAGFKTEDAIRRIRTQEGRVPVYDDEGKIKRNADGTMVVRNLQPEEMSPEELSKLQNIQAQREYRLAQAKATIIRARAAQMTAERKAREAKEARAPGAVEEWARLITDPTTGVNLSTVPSAARGDVIKYAAAHGMKVAKPLTGDEIKRMDLANNAIDNIEHAQEILHRRPDMFGPGGWMGTKFAMLLNGGDPDARDFAADINLANLPAVGIHGVRGKWALQDLSSYDGNLYQNAESMEAVLNDIHRSAQLFRDNAGRPASIRGGQGGQPQRPANVPPGYVFREGPKGKGWYKPDAASAQ